MIRLGASFPQTEIGADPSTIRDWAVAVEALGFDYILAYDHVLGASPDHPAIAGSRFHFTHESMVHEPLVLFGYLAAITRRVDLVSGIIILPQRQTALVAKQAAEVDVLSGGRLRLGVGLGWNPVEFEALGQEFHDRGRRVEEQIEVMRLLWTQQLVNFQGKWHTITNAGLNPLPVQRPIPIWIGGTDDRAIERVGRIGDGLLAMGRPDPDNERRVGLMRDAARRAGRDPSALQLVATIGPRGGTTPDDWRRDLETWQRLDITHVSVNSLNMGCRGIAEHLDAVDRVRRVLAPLVD